MTRKPSTVLCAGALVAGLAAPMFGAEAGQTSEADALRQEVAQLRAEVAQMRQQENEQWMNERRAEEVKALVHEVLSDAETRSSLLQEGRSAGYDEGFAISSVDGGNLLKVNGLVQARYILNSGDRHVHDASEDDWEGGFTVPRAKIQLSGHIANPRVNYKLRLAVDEDDNDASFEVAKISYQLRDDLSIWGGETKAPFLREELVGAGQQLAAERSLVNEVFTMGYVQGVGVKWMPMDNIKIRGSVNDGVRSGEIEDRHEADLHIGAEENDKQFDEDNTDFALTGRVDVALAGDWDQARDFTAWNGEPMGIFAGAGVHYEEGETGDNDGNNDFWAWTVDAAFEQQGWSAFGAVHGLHTDMEAADRYQDYYGAVAQAAYNIDDTYQPFVRYEYLDMDDTLDDNYINLVTAGMNWYNSKHNAKFTADVVWALDEVPTATELGTTASSLDRLGLIPDEADEEDQVALRLQYQLMF